HVLPEKFHSLPPRFGGIQSSFSSYTAVGCPAARALLAALAFWEGPSGVAEKLLPVGSHPATGPAQQREGLKALAAAVDLLLVREAGQPTIVVGRCAGPIRFALAGEAAGDLAALHVRRSARHAEPCLVVAARGLYDGGGTPALAFHPVEGRG